MDVESCEFSMREILAMTQADELFSSQPKNVEIEYRRLVKRWHPDLPHGNTNVLTHINVLHDQAEQQIAAGVWYYYQNHPRPAPAEPVRAAPVQPEPVHTPPMAEMARASLATVLGLWTLYGLLPASILFLVLTAPRTLVALALLTFLGSYAVPRVLRRFGWRIVWTPAAI